MWRDKCHELFNIQKHTQLTRYVVKQERKIKMKMKTTNRKQNVSIREKMENLKTKSPKTEAAKQ